MISRGDVNPTEHVGIFDATNLSWIFMETRSCEAKRFPSNFPGGAKRTSVDTRGVSAGTGSVCKLFVRKAQREKGGEK